MIELRAISNTATDRTLICVVRSDHSDVDIPVRIRFNRERVELTPNLDGLEWILNKDRGHLIESIRDLVTAWSD